jgi:ferritin
MNAKIQDAMNEQIKNELYSAYMYLAMAAYLDANDFPGMARWMQLQSQEEVEHGMKFFAFINDRGGRVVLKGIDEPPAEWDSPLAVFTEALEHERKVTAMINEIYALAIAENDYPSQTMLHWFIDEQVEEEKSAGDIVAFLKKAEGNVGALMMLDSQLGSRTAHAHE